MINRITFGSDKAARTAFHSMLQEVRAEGQPLGSVDFNKLVPMPSELNIDSGSRTDTGLKLFGNYLCEAAQVAANMPDATPNERAAALFRHMDSWQKKHKVDPEVWELGKKAYRNIQKYGCATWREWRGLNWGNKWNAYQCARWMKGRTPWNFRRRTVLFPRSRRRSPNDSPARL